MAIDMNRRDFFRAGAAGVAAVSSLTAGAAADTPGQISPKQPDAANSCYITEEGASILFGNEKLELNIDRETGFFRHIRSKVTGRQHKLENDGSWPFGMHLGYPNMPEFLYVEIASNTPYPQKMSYTSTHSSPGMTLGMQYDDLLSSGGTLTGVKLHTEITLQNDADYFLIKATLNNRGKYSITNFFSGTGALVAADTREQETLVVPGWDYGKLYPNPHEFFDRRETFGYPNFGSSCALVAGWLDLMGPEGGVGVGYLNRQGLTMLFNVQQADQGLNVNWQLFNLEHEDNQWARMGGVFALEPGQSFSTDQWILACHAGDWHRMADIYRTEYEKAFHGTFLNERNNHPVATQIDFVAGLTIHSEATPGAPSRRFNEVVDYVKELSETLGTSPGNILLVLLGHNEQWPYHMPDFLPCNTDAGGDEACRRMMEDLAELGMKSVLLYGHPYYNHPQALDYVEKADTGYDHLNRFWPKIGNVACLGSPDWQNLWREKYIPGYDELGAAGVYWDQGPTQYLVCPRADHPHGADAVKQLASHTKGILELQQHFLDIYKTRRPMFWTEVSSDLTGRTMDVWTTTEGGYARGGILQREIVRYAIPYHLCANIGASSYEEVNDSLINGFIVWASPAGAEEVMLGQREYARIRQELRRVKAPGFPYGFRDRVGLSSSNPSLVARSFRNEEGITVLYFAKESLQADVVVDASALGFPGKGMETFTVSLRKNEAGYRILTS